MNANSSVTIELPTNRTYLIAGTNAFGAGPIFFARSGNNGADVAITMIATNSYFSCESVDKNHIKCTTTSLSLIDMVGICFSYSADSIVS